MHLSFNLSFLKKEFKQNIKVILLSLTFISLTIKENINSIALIVLFIFSTAQYIKDKKKNAPTYYYPIILFFILTVLNLLLFDSYDFSETKKYLLRALLFLIIPIIFIFIKISRKELLRIELYYVLWIILNAIYSHLTMISLLITKNESLNLLFRKDYSYIKLADTIGLDSTYYSFFVLLAIILLFNFLLVAKKKLYVGIYLTAILYLSFFIIHLSSRMNIVALVILILFYIFYYFILRKKAILGIVVTITSAIILSTALYNVRATRYRFQQIIGFTFSNGTTHRDGLNKLRQFDAAIEANKSILFGNGIQNANNAIIKSYERNGLLHFAKERYNAHNQYIQIYVGAGIIGELTLIFLIFYYSVFFWKSKNITGFLFVTLISFLFLTESYLERHNGIVLFTLFICLQVNYDLSSSEKGKANKISIHKNGN
ncbi:O-antigen ligase family protein [Galbibacter pacificus]|uniref:O-antigen ligase family protein n=1 Tax=Galbibacter pacificus TaxID=2996052 RepID=A0ABT6FNC6_9FLAO|nr:O-antigen ligase family protein [Galbibacter pacificus]MDG3581297.1 O-antigen ligase family protein [Galbibacter pacificus]MDG3584775.1 O-antigen ligase family protein [Galbibacter pacificus]